jgi:hypothetical protein
MAYSSSDILNICHLLGVHGHFRTFRPGQTLGRGFADLGFEEFLLLPNGRLLSTLTGQISEMKKAEEDHFFVIPTVDEISDALVSHGYEISPIEFIENRFWRIEILRGTIRAEVKNPSLSEAFLHAFASLHELPLNHSAPRKLRVLAGRASDPSSAEVA